MSDQKLFVEVLANARTMHGEFFEGEVRLVDPEVAGLLINSGWARYQESTVLEVQNLNLNTKAESVEADNG